MPCPEGTFGSRSGEENFLCSGPCPAGHFCMGGAAASADGSPLNDRVHPCAAGSFGSAGQGRRSCEGPCAAGYYCPTGSSVPDQLPCGGAHLFCPLGSSSPSSVRPGFYSLTEAGGVDSVLTRTHEAPCPEGSYCTQGVRQPCPAGTFGRDARLATAACSGRCQKGFFCPAGSVTRIQRACPFGTFGADEGLGDEACSGSCLNPLDCPEGTVIPLRSL